LSRQSQAIASEFLSSASDGTGKYYILDRKADFTLSFSYIILLVKDLYTCLRITNNYVVSYMTDAFTKTTALFSCVDIKPASGDYTEAEYQLSIWMAASLWKKMQLARRVGLVDKGNLVEPCFAIVGYRMYVYFVYVGSEERNMVHILGLEVGLFSLCETSSVSGIFRALRLWRNVIKYGRDEGSSRF
jgi:hypothetical protein